MPMIFKDVNEGGEPMDLVATHQRLLVGAALRTQGPILELGVGWYSTPILHEIAKATKRHLWTVDNNIDWLGQFLPLESTFHKVQLTGWWGEAYEELAKVRWGLVFVDHGQPCEREYAVRALLGCTDVFVMHDTEEGFAYGYDRLLGNLRYGRKKDEDQVNLGLFQYQYTDKAQKAWTTVASNRFDVTKWFGDLPPVEPSKEVT